MNDYIVWLCEKYDVYFGCVFVMILDCWDFWRYCVVVLEMVVFVYCLESIWWLYYVVIIVGMSQVLMYFVFYMGKVCWFVELICYFDELGGDDLCYL